MVGQFCMNFKIIVERTLSCKLLQTYCMVEILNNRLKCTLSFCIILLNLRHINHKIFIVVECLHLLIFKLYDLPLEVLDTILQKSYLHWSLNSPKRQKDEEVIRSLISVDVCFNRRITRQRFKKTLWRHLKG